MAKGKALFLGITCLTIACLFLAVGAPVCMTAFLLGAVIFLGIWFAKYQRDQCIIRQAKQERLHIAEAPPPIVSQGSHQVFVPPPLESHRQQPMRPFGKEHVG